MSDRPTPPTVLRNRFLARLPEPSYRRLLPHLEPAEFATGQVLYELGGPIESAYFPAGAVLSALVVMRDGGVIEVGTVGFEGLVGHHGFGGRTSPHRVLVRIAGPALRIPAPALLDLAEGDAPLREMLAAYHIAFMAQVSQSVACNGLHAIQQRCCRWLLMSRDRVGSDELRLTHEYLAIMLGARRASVTEALQPLQAEGLIRCERGRILLLDGAALEDRSCECYFVVRDEYRRLLGGMA